MSQCVGCSSPKSGCLARVMGDCSFYTGATHTGSSINSGDDFDTVVNKLINFVNISGSNVDGQNLGATGTGIFFQKSGAFLQFKKLKAGSNITISSDANSITIDSTGGGGGGGQLVDVY